MTPHIIGNWKMNKTISEAKTFVSSLALTANNASAQIGLAVPFTMIATAAEAARGSAVSIGGQTLYEEPSGAFTGEISGALLKDAGASFVLVGHSERRTLFHETDEQINKKLHAAFDSELKAILCIGETLEQHRAGATHAVLEEQLRKCLLKISPEQCMRLMIAYEPIWAIGTGNTATPEIAQAAHRFCREVVTASLGEIVAATLPILYGGSVKPENAGELLKEPDINGFLIGGAALSLESFTKIIHCH